MEELQSCHSEAHTLLYGTNPLNRQRLDPSLFGKIVFECCQKYFTICFFFVTYKLQDINN